MPRTRNPKSKVVQVRLTPEEKLRIEQVAAREGGTKSSWIYELVMRELARNEEREPVLKVAERRRDS